MVYLFGKILFCLLLAAGLGGIVGWLLRAAARRDRVADVESGWRRRLDTIEKERIALAAERDRLVRENASVKSLHSECGTRIAKLQGQVEAAREAHDGYDENVTRLELEVRSLKKRLEEGETAAPAVPDTSPGPDTADAEERDREARGGGGEEEGVFELPLPGESGPHDTDAAPVEDGEEEKDDLKKIKGIGRVLERSLRELGVFRFRQIARWTEEDVARVAQTLETFPGRIERDRWISQAAALHEKKYGEKA